MEKFFRANCDFSAYINSLHPNLNVCSEKSIFVGNIFNQNPTKCNIFLSLLKFTLPKIECNNIESATLYLYFEDLKCFNKTSYTIRIYENTTILNTSNISFSTLPQISKNNFYELTLGPKDLSKYVEVDITPTLTSWLESKENFGLTLTTLSSISTFLIQLSSSNASKPPYILISLSSDKSSNLDESNDYTNKDEPNSEIDSIVNTATHCPSNDDYEEPSSNEDSDNHYTDVNIANVSKENFDSLSSLVNSIDNTVNYTLQDLNKVKSNFTTELNTIKDFLKSLTTCPKNINELIDEVTKKIDSIDEKYCNEIELLNNKIDDLNRYIYEEKNNASSASKLSESYYNEIKYLQEEVKKLKLILTEISIEPLN